MLTAQQFIGAAGEGVNRIDFALAGVVAGSAYYRIVCVLRNAKAAGFIKVAVKIELLTVEEHLVVRAVQREIPAVGEILLEINKNFLVLFIVVGPLRRGVIAATGMDLRAVGVPARRAAPHRRIGIDLRELIAHGKGCGISQVGIHHAIDKLLLRAVAFDKAVLVIIASDQTTTDAAVTVEGGREIGDIALFAPAAVGSGDAAGECFAVSMFPHHIDGGGRIARPGQQTGRAAHHFHTFVKRHIGLGIAEIPARGEGGRNAVDHKIVDGEAASVVSRAIHIAAHAGNRRGGVQHVIQRLKLLIFHALLADHGNRLRNIACGERHFGARAGNRHAVIASVLLPGAAGAGVYVKRLFVWCRRIGGLSALRDAGGDQHGQQRALQRVFHGAGAIALAEFPDAVNIKRHRCSSFFFIGCGCHWLPRRITCPAVRRSTNAIL